MKDGGIKFEFCRKGALSGKCLTDSSVSLFEAFDIFDSGNAEVRKVGSKIIAAIAGDVFVKCYFYKGFVSRFRHLFCVSRAKSSVDCALAIQKTGVPTPQVLGWLREGGLLLPHRDFLFTERLGEETVFMPLFLQESPEDAVKKITECVVKLHQAGIQHGDLSLRNLYISGAGSAGVIDLDGCKLYSGPLSFRKRVREMSRVISSAAKITEKISLSRFKALFLSEYKAQCGIDLACSQLDSQTEYLYNRRRA